MMKKFELMTESKMNVFGKTLFRIRALVDFSFVKAGDVGGWIEEEGNLSQYGDAWVYGNAEVYGNACVYGDARVCGDARVYGDTRVYGNACVCGDARVYGNARVYGYAWVCGDTRVYGNAEVYGDARVYGDACVCGDDDYTTIKGFGTCFRTTTFFRCKDKTVKVACGCFLGTIAEFRKQVKRTRSGKIAKEYLMIADLMEMHFKEGEDEQY